VSTDTANAAAAAQLGWAERLSAFRRGRRTRFAAAIAIDLVLVYALWEVLTATGTLSPRYFPRPQAVVERLGVLLTQMSFWAVVWATVQSWLLGLVIGCVSGTIAGVLLGSSERAYRFCRVVIELLRPIPPIVILPIVLLVLGVTLQFKLVLIFQGIFWLMLLQAIYGVRSVDAVMLETARSYGISGLRRFFTVQLPGALPFIVTGVRIAAMFALVVSIVAELVGGAAGLGNDILKAQSAGDDTTMYALILFCGVLGVVITSSFSALERHVLFWHPSQRSKTP
jgi:ABC-type nitrate/sulfonate/bicarbonate transport system permease component